MVISDESKSYDKLQTIAWFPLRPPSALQNVWRCEVLFSSIRKPIGKQIGEIVAFDWSPMERSRVTESRRFFHES